MLRDTLLNLWERLQGAPFFQALPPWLREPPGLWIALGVLVLTFFWLLWRLLLRGKPKARKGHLREVVRSERRELRELERHGSFRELGERYEALGKPKKALGAYRRGACHAEAAQLLLTLDRPEEARREAREGKAWALYAELSERAGEPREAAPAWARCGRYLEAAQAWERAGRRHEAAEAYGQAGKAEKAVSLLAEESGRRTAEQLERIVRAELERSNASLSRGAQTALRRAAQLWLAEGEAGRAFRLVVDAEAWQFAVPIVRDHLPPSPETAETAERAGALDVAADLFEKLGETRRSALLRADAAIEREDPAEAGRFFEAAEEWGAAAEQWAAAGELERSAELYARTGDRQSAAKLYARAGNAAKEREMLQELELSRAATSKELPAGEATPVPSPSPPLSETADDARYQLIEEIGRGGMGVVYRAHDRTLEREVAYKVLPAEVEQAEGEALLVEARAAARLSHPNIVQVYDAGHSQRGYFIVMEYVEGETIQALLGRQRFSIPGAVYLGRQICAALIHAHERRIIHRDLKPSNLIFTPSKRLKLTDFGLARAFDHADEVMTRAAGTPFYMAPEQIKGDPVTPQTDLYSLGCVLYELVCGKAPFAGGSSIYHHLNTAPTAPSAKRQGVPGELSALILHCLEKEPGERPLSAKEVAQRLAEMA